MNVFKLISGVVLSVFIYANASLLAHAQQSSAPVAQQNTTDQKDTKTQAAKPAAAAASPKQLKIGKFNFSGSLRLRAENYSWWETPGFDDSYTFGAAVLRLSLGQQGEKADWFVEGEFPLLMNLPEHAIAPAPQGQLGLGAAYFAANGHQDGSAVLKQAYVRVKNLFDDKSSSVRFGRFEFV